MQRFIQLRAILEDLEMAAIFEKQAAEIVGSASPDRASDHAKRISVFLRTWATFDAVDYDLKTLVQGRSR